MATIDEINALKEELAEALEKVKEIKDAHSDILEEEASIEEAINNLEDFFESTLNEISSDSRSSYDYEDDEESIDEEDYS